MVDSDFIGDSERYVATLWDQRDIEREPGFIREGDRHASTPWNWKTK